LLDRRGRERDADRVADALAQQDAEGDGGLDGALEGGPCLGDAQVQRPVPRLGELAVRLDHDDRVVVLHGDAEVVEAVLLEEGGLPLRGGDQGLRGDAVAGHHALVDAAGVHADAQGGAVVVRGLGDVLDLVVEAADVAGVHADPCAAGLDRGEDVLGLEVDVGDHRDRGLRGDRDQRVGVLLPGAGHAHDVAARRGQLRDLLQGRVDVVRGGGGHRLHRDRCVAAHVEVAELDLAGLPPGGEHRRWLLDGGDTEAHRSHMIIMDSPPPACEGRCVTSTAPARRWWPSPQGPGRVHARRGRSAPAAERVLGASRQGNSVMGLTMSAYSSSTVITRSTRATALVTGSIRDMSTGPGSGRPRRRARERRAPSSSAPATCPPSSGSSGTRLNTNSAMFSEASIETNVPLFSRSSKPGCSAEATSPARRETPTTPSGPSGSRSALPKAACPTSHSRTGRVSTSRPVPVKAVHAISGTAAGDCGSRSGVPATPRKPTCSVTRSPAASWTAAPSSSRTGRSSTTIVACSSSSSPSLSTTTSTVRSPASRTAVVTSCQRWIRWPSISRSVSPGRIPAASAGAGGRPSQLTSAGASAGTTHSETDCTVGVIAGRPIPLTSTSMSTTEMSRFMAGPPSITTSFFGTDSATKVRWASSGPYCADS